MLRTGDQGQGAHHPHPTEGPTHPYQGSNFNNQTIRVDLRPSISGNTVRIKRDNALGTSALSIAHATVALSPDLSGG